VVYLTVGEEKKWGRREVKSDKWEEDRNVDGRTLFDVGPDFAVGCKWKWTLLLSMPGTYCLLLQENTYVKIQQQPPLVHVVKIPKLDHRQMVRGQD
jgi:hypothetical protein